MPLSRLERIAIGLGVLGVLSFAGGIISANHFRSQKQIDSQVTRVSEIDREIGKVSQRVHDMFYFRDQKGYERPVAGFLDPKNRQTIIQSWPEYDRLKEEYNAAISQPGVKEIVEKNRRLDNSAGNSIVIGYTAFSFLAGLGFVLGFFEYIHRPRKEINYAEAQPSNPQVGH